MSNGPILVDTSVWIPYLRSNPKPQLVEWVRNALSASSVATTGIIKVELLRATRTPAEFQRLKSVLDALQQLWPTPETWERAAQNGFALRRAGVSVPTTDLLIATVARQYGASVAHIDRHFELLSPHLGIPTVSFL